MKSKNLPNGSVNRTRIAIFLLVISVVIAVVYFLSKPQSSIEDIEENNHVDADKVVNGIHVSTGFINAPGMQETVNNCTICHSAQLVLMNRMNKERWKATIVWMQETQNLWDLGDNEAIIIDYLVKNYPPISKGRREALTNIEWYELKQ